jgi:hypothetical protein
VSSEILAQEVPDNDPREWTKQAVITVEETTKAYMVEVIAEFNC